MPRYAAKVDSNQQDIVRALRACGASVTPTHMVGAGYPDLTVGFRGRTLLLEVKDGTRKWQLTPDEQRWHDEWRGQVAIVESAEDAVRLLLEAT